MVGVGELGLGERSPIGAIIIKSSLELCGLKFFPSAFSGTAAAGSRAGELSRIKHSVLCSKVLCICDFGVGNLAVRN